MFDPLLKLIERPCWNVGNVASNWRTAGGLRRALNMPRCPSGPLIIHDQIWSKGQQAPTRARVPTLVGKIRSGLSAGSLFYDSTTAQDAVVEALNGNQQGYDALLNITPNAGQQ
jgi:hypothetical protein